MPVHRIPIADVLAEGARFDTVIDARSPSEYADDHLPQAVNWPSLDDEQRHLVGTEYAKISPTAKGLMDELTKAAAKK